MNAAFSPHDDFLHLLHTAMSAEQTDDVERIKNVLDTGRDYPGMLGIVNLSAESHCAISADEMVMASAVSGQDTRAKGVLRARA